MPNMNIDFGSMLENNIQHILIDEDMLFQGFSFDSSGNLGMVYETKHSSMKSRVVAERGYGELYNEWYERKGKNYIDNIRKFILSRNVKVFSQLTEEDKIAFRLMFI